MKRILSTVAVAGVLISFVPLKADAQTVSVNISYTCATWANVRNDEGVTMLIAGHWLAGVMTGFALSSGKDFWGDLDHNQVMFWMDRYCDSNPLSDVLVGVGDLMIERFGNNWR